MRAHNAKFSSKDIVEESVKKLYKNNNDIIESFKKHYTQTDKKRSSKKTLSVNEENEIESELQKSETPEIFLNYLNTKFDKVYLSNIESTEKDYLLQSLIIYKVSTEFLCKNNDLVIVSEVQNKSGLRVLVTGRRVIWWEKWGKCAAGTVGGAGIGALTGAGIGSAIPAIGTLAGGIVGGIAGGLSGAAEHCK